MTTTNALPSYLKVEDTIGSSSRSIVYRATDVRTDRTVAVKVLRQVLWMSRAEQVGLRRRIAEAVAPFSALDQRSIAAVHEVGVYEGTLYVVRDMVEGRSVAQMLAAQGALDIDAAVALVTPVAEALDVLARRGLAHGAVTPENVFVGGDGAITLTDGGFGRAASDFQLAGVRCRARGAADGGSDLSAIAALVFTLASGYSPVMGNGGLDRGFHLSESARCAIYRAMGGGRRYRSACEFVSALSGWRHAGHAGWRPNLRPVAATGAFGALVLLGGPTAHFAGHRSPAPAPVAQVAAAAQRTVDGVSLADAARIRLAARRQGLAVLSYPVVADVVGLTEPQRAAIASYLAEQRDRVAAVVDDVAAGRIHDSRAAMQEVRDTAQMRVLGLLDAAQRKRWDDLVQPTGAPGEPVL